MIGALGVLTQYVTVIEQPRDRAAPRRPAQASMLAPRCMLPEASLHLQCHTHSEVRCGHDPTPHRFTSDSKLFAT